MATPFEKDFGYLMPFLDKIDAAARALSDPSARTEAMQLVAGERQRWERLKALLAGAAGTSAGQTSGKMEPALSLSGPTAARRVEPPRSPSSPPQRSEGGSNAGPVGFTVGRLTPPR